MTDVENPNQPTADEPEKEHSEPSGPRYPAFQFISIFVVSVLVLLTGYRYAVNTQANDWYLYQVARNTTTALNWIGQSALLENEERSKVNPAEARASLAAWARGEDKATPEDYLQVSKERLTTWERYSFRIQQSRRAKGHGILGPHVTFVWKPGVTERITQAEAELTALQNNSSLPETEKASQMAALATRLDTLRAEQEHNRLDPALQRLNRGISFSFFIIPECGAIEVMAIFFAAVIAFPTLWRRRLIGLLVGLPIMYLVNILRLTCLAVIGALDSSREWFDFSHHYAWQAIYIVFVVAVWLCWVEIVVRERPESSGGLLGSLVATFKQFRLGWLAALCFFCIKFLVFVTVLVVAWWLLLPVYGYVLVQLSGAILRYAMNVPIVAGWIETGGVLNTDSWLFFRIEGYAYEKKTAIALLITNLPPYLALVLATPGLRLMRRLRIMLYGSAILISGHILFLVIVLRYQEALQKEALQSFSELPMAVMQFYLTLPFLLWIVFAYLHRRLSTAQREKKPVAATPDPRSDTPQQ